ncbi:MAG: A/G-specific adenine glycosylase [Verrucomicrobia bacterium]|nr:A/G-specific adenine glycosylase [Verrucomicrobiota bacterium]
MKEIDIVHSLLAWFAGNARDLPWRRTRDPYAIWVSEIMLQQTQVKTVLPYWERWMRLLPNLQALAKAKPERLHKLWEGLGYYSRVRNLQRAAQFVCKNHGGKFPRDFDEVLALPGIGRYTAGAICSIAFNQPKPILDGNVIRVLTRLYGVAGNPRERYTNARLWQLTEALVLQAAKIEVPSKNSDHAARAEGLATKGNGRRTCARLNESLMELGALVCTPRAPRCGACPIRRFCVAYRQDRILLLPNPGRHRRPTPRRFVAFVMQRRGRFLLRQRPPGGVNAHLWEFPNLELVPEDSDLNRAACQALGIRAKSLEPICTIKHSITRYRITLEAYRVVADQAPEISAPHRRWLHRGRLRQLAFTSAHKQILQRLDNE